MWIAEALLKHCLFIFLSDLIVVEPKPFLELSIIDEGIIMSHLCSAFMNQDGMELVGNLFKGVFDFLNFLLNLLELELQLLYLFVATLLVLL